jgi:hypothetical protein
VKLLSMFEMRIKKEILVRIYDAYFLSNASICMVQLIITINQKLDNVTIIFAHNFH